MRRALLVLVLVFASSTAYADAPWEQGISKAQRDRAQALFAEGNTLFAQQAHGPALAKYKEAIALWDHPLVRFNMAVTEIRMDRILAAAEDLEAALRFGDAPFSAEMYRQALDYQTLVAGRVGVIDASCDQAGAQVQLDGKPWFQCPGSQKQRVLAGEHVLVGEKPDFLTYSRRVVVTGNATATDRIQLVPLDDVVRYEYPAPKWLPWTTAGAGGAIAFGGLAFWFAGQSQMDQFEADFARVCPTGCSLADQPQLARDHDSARLKGTIAVTMMASGGVLAIGGLVWGRFINKPRRIVPNVPSVEVQPTAGGATATLAWRF